MLRADFPSRWRGTLTAHLRRLAALKVGENSMSKYGTRKESDLVTRARAESVIKRVYEAVECLCTGKGDVRERLKTAAVYLVFLQEEEFPDHLRTDFAWIIQQSTRYKTEFPTHEGSIDATMKQISNVTGQKIAERIFRLYSDLQNIRGFPLLEYRHPDD